MRAEVNHAFITGSDGHGMTDLNSLVDRPYWFVLQNGVDINTWGR
jgi:hypothetical protein